MVGDAVPALAAMLGDPERARRAAEGKAFAAGMRTTRRTLSGKPGIVMPERGAAGESRVPTGASSVPRIGLHPAKPAGQPAILATPGRRVAHPPLEHPGGGGAEVLVGG